MLLIAESDAQMKEFSLALRENGLDVYGTSSNTQGLRAFYSFRPSLVLLDMDVNEFDGWEFCTHIREMSETPIIVMSDDSDRNNLLRGYEVGIDKFVVKPVCKRDLVQSVYSVLRRRASSNDSVEFPAPFETDGLMIDWSRNEVRANGNHLSLSPTEFKLLWFLAQNRGRVLTHEQILSRVWGPEYIDDKSYVKLYIRYLREKIEQEPSNPKWIVTARGFGYKFAA